MNDGEKIVLLDGKDPRTAEVLYRITFEANQGQTTWKVSSFQMELSEKNNLYLGYQIDEQLVGYIGCQIVLDEMSINNFAVLPTYKKRGIGTALLEQLVAICEQKSVCNFYLEVRVSNLAAISLYKRAGFKQIALRKDYYQKPKEDAYILQLEKSQ